MPRRSRPDAPIDDNIGASGEKGNPRPHGASRSARGSPRVALRDGRSTLHIRGPFLRAIMSLHVPNAIHMPRLLLRRWHPDDAPLLQAVLDANGAHLRPWIPAHVAESAPLPALAERLAGYRDDFDAGRTWLYAILAPDATRLLGGVGLYPRTAAARVAADVADRVEIGYWLAADATGAGHATEAARAMLDVARTLPGLGRVEIRCDARNAPSMAVPRRLGFHPERTEPVAGAPDAALVIWTRDAGAAPAQREPPEPRVGDG